MKKESFSYVEIKEGISKALFKMHKDFISNGFIHGLSKYQTEYMTRNHLRKLTEMGILSKLRSSKKNMQYEWVSINLDYDRLAEDVLQYSNKKVPIDFKLLPNDEKVIIITPSFTNKLASQITLILSKNGVDDKLIPDVTGQILNLLMPE